MKTVEIRRPRKTDLARIIDFFQLVVNDTFSKEGISHLKEDMEEEIQNKIHHLHMDLKSDGKERYFLIALDHDRVIGTIEHGPCSQLITECTNGAFKNLIEIGTVFVRPEYQNQGIGTLLLNVIYLSLQSQGIDQLCLDSGYAHAQKVWKKKFGDPDYLLKNYWGEGQDHMIWGRNIKDLPIRFRV